MQVDLGAVAVLAAIVCLVISALFALRAVRIHGRGKPAWHLLAASWNHLDPSAYPPRAVHLAARSRLFAYLGMALLAAAAVLRVLGDA